MEGTLNYTQYFRWNKWDFVNGHLDQGMLWYLFYLRNPVGTWSHYVGSMRDKVCTPRSLTRDCKDSSVLRPSSSGSLIIFGAAPSRGWANPATHRATIGSGWTLTTRQHHWTQHAWVALRTRPSNAVRGGRI